jgi:hypothetical protein
LLPTIVQPWERVEKQKGARVAMEIAAALFSLATPNLPRLLRFYQALLGIPPQVGFLPRESRCMGSFGCRDCDWASTTAVMPELAVPGRAASLCLQVRDLAGYLGSLAAVLAEYQISPSPLRQALSRPRGGAVGSRWQSHRPAPAFGPFLGGNGPRPDPSRRVLELTAPGTAALPGAGFEGAKIAPSLQRRGER